MRIITTILHIGAVLKSTCPIKTRKRNTFPHFIKMRAGVVVIIVFLQFFHVPNVSILPGNIEDNVDHLNILY